MKKVLLTCTYCNKQWEKFVYAYSNNKEECTKCGHKKLKMTPTDSETSKDVYGYNYKKEDRDGE